MSKMFLIGIIISPSSNGISKFLEKNYEKMYYGWDYDIEKILYQIDEDGYGNVLNIDIVQNDHYQFYFGVSYKIKDGLSEKKIKSVFSYMKRIVLKYNMKKDIRIFYIDDF